MNMMLRTLRLPIEWVLGAALVAGTASAAPVKIGVLLTDGTNPVGLALIKAFPEAANEYGAEVVVKATPVAEQMGLMNKMLMTWSDQGEMQAIVVTAAIEPQAIIPALQTFRKKGIPVVAMLGRIPGDVAQTHVQVDEDSLNTAAFELCAPLVSDGDEIGLLRAVTHDGAMTDREKSIIVGLRARYPKVVIHADIYRGIDKEKEEDQVRLLLGKYPKIKLLYSAYSPSSLAGIKVLHELGPTKKIRHIAVGSGVPAECVAALRNSELDAWIAMAPRDVAFRSIEAAVNLVNGKSQPELILTKVRVVTKANLDSPEIKPLLP